MRWRTSAPMSWLQEMTTRIMLCSLLGIDVGPFRDRIRMPVASISIVEMAVHGRLLHMMGDRSYLREQLRRRVGT